MFLPQNTVYANPANVNLNPGDASLLGKTVNINLDRTYPIEDIIIRVFFVVSGTALTIFPATAQTPDQLDNILQLLKRATLSVNEGTGAGVIKKVDCDGVRLLEFNSLTGLNLDAPTLNLIGLSQGTTIAASTAYQLTYRIPMAETMVSEPLRSRLLLPAHRYTQDPILTLQFQTAANIYSAGAIATLGCTVELVRRQATPASEAVLQQFAQKNPNSVDQWGYVRWDLIQQDFAPASTNAPQKFPLALGASYLNMLVSQYLGGANITKNVLDSSGIGDTVAHGFGNETVWDFETAQVPDFQFRWRDIMARNQLMGVKNNITQSSSPGFGGGVISGTNFQAASVVLFDFLRDAEAGAGAGNELGSVLNCNLSGSLKKELVGTLATWATNGHQLSLMGRRLFGDLSPWQALA